MTVIGYLRFQLTLLEPGGVCSPSQPFKTADGRIGVQLPLDLDDEGRPNLPATSVAGALRAHLTNQFGRDFTTRVLGADADGSDQRAVASSLAVHHTHLDGPAPKTSRHATTAIDPSRGAATNRALRVAEQAPVGTAWNVYCSWRNPDPNDWAALVSVLATWQPFLGRAVSNGNGRSHVSDLATGQLDLTRTDDLLLFLTEHGVSLVDKAASIYHELGTPTAPPLLHELCCEIQQALHIGTGETTTTIDRDGNERAHAAIRLDNGVPIVPGTTIRGLLRSRIAYILRSVHAVPDPCLEYDCAQCLPCQIFGYRASPHAAQTNSRRAHVRITNAHITIPDQRGASAVTTRTHAPIDRFTGGVATQTPTKADQPWDPRIPAGQLHTDEVIERGTFTIRIEDLGLPTPHRLLFEALLRLVAEDLNHGIVTVGGGGTRGYGRIRLDTASLPSLAEAQATLRSHLHESTPPDAD